MNDESPYKRLHPNVTKRRTVRLTLQVDQSWSLTRLVLDYARDICMRIHHYALSTSQGASLPSVNAYIMITLVPVDSAFEMLMSHHSCCPADMYTQSCRTAADMLGL